MEQMGDQKETIRGLYWSESIANTGYNVKFQVMTYFQQTTPNKLIKKYEQVYLLGTKYSANPDNSEEISARIYEQFCSIPWMTYRAIFPEMDSTKGTYVTDTGWGCMVRVGQMLMAQILKKHLKLNSQQDMLKILPYFNDYDSSEMFSIQNISKMAREQYELPPGKWYNPSQISYILSDLYKFEQKNPYKQTLDFVVLNNATLFYDQILTKMCGIKQLCKCKKANVVCYKCYKKQKSICLVILSRIGLQHPEKKYLNVINKMMECEMFQGMIGGKPEKALYFVGKNFDQYIYLDPHTVQQGVSSKSLERLVDTYFCKSFRSCKNTAIDPSVGICFYLENLESIDKLYTFMKSLKQSEPEDFFLFSSINTPDYMRTTEEIKNQIEPSQTEVFEHLESHD